MELSIGFEMEEDKKLSWGSSMECRSNQDGTHQQGQHQISFETIQSQIPATGNLITKESGGYDMGEFDQALFLYLEGQDHRSTQDQRQSSGITPPTLNIFPSQPMHEYPSTKESMNLIATPSRMNSKSAQKPLKLSSSQTEMPSQSDSGRREIKIGPKQREINRKITANSEQEGPRTPDPKTLRRLAQNREAARKSRLRKKAYVQQLENSRMKLTQLEQELQRVRSQGFLLGGEGLMGDQNLPFGMGGVSSEAAMFDAEYGRWLEEHHRMMCELRAAVEEHLPENDLKVFVHSCLAHYDKMMDLKSVVVKSDVFHIFSGLWKTPAERCFMWMGGFRPSNIIKISLSHVEPLTEQQFTGMCSLQQSTQETEEALSQGLEALHQSLSATIASEELSCPSNVANYMNQMAIAMNKLSTIEVFVHQAENLRHQTLQRLHQILTTRQAARFLLAIAEYFHRLRSLSSLWLARPRQE